jgi:hypothetical protein
MAIPPRYAWAKFFSEGLAAVNVGGDWTGGGGKWGYIDRSGTLVIPAQFDFAEDFSGGLALVNVEGETGLAARHVHGGAHGYIDRNGQWVREPASQ